MSISWERHPGAVETLTLRCDGCKMTKKWNLGPGTFVRQRREDVEDLYREAGGIKLDADGRDRCSACYRRIRGQGAAECRETTSSTDDLLEAFKMAAGYGMRAGKTSTVNAILESAIDKERERQERFRAAMQGMANVMRGVWYALDHLYDTIENMRDDSELRNTVIDNTTATRRMASVEWSRRVREGVKALRPPGPVVACQGDWEDD